MGTYVRIDPCDRGSSEFIIRHEVQGTPEGGILYETYDYEEPRWLLDNKSRPMVTDFLGSKITLFYGHKCCPIGGWRDFMGYFQSIEEAQKFSADQPRVAGSWAHVVINGEIVCSGVCESTFSPSWGTCWRWFHIEKRKKGGFPVGCKIEEYKQALEKMARLCDILESLTDWPDAPSLNDLRNEVSWLEGEIRYQEEHHANAISTPDAHLED